MSPSRTIVEVERALAGNRAELARALEDLRTSSQRVADVRVHVDRYAAHARSAVEREGDRLEKLTAALGFVLGGGASGAAGLPFKAVRVALGRPASRSRLEVVAMKQDRNSRQLGSALAAVAAADSQLRGGRVRGAGSRRWIARLFRPLLVLGTAGAGVAFVVADEERRGVLAKVGDDLLDRVFAASP